MSTFSIRGYVIPLRKKGWASAGVEHEKKRRSIYGLLINNTASGKRESSEGSATSGRR
jgi:hypothetical protein